MARMTKEQAERFLYGSSHRGTAILSISCAGRGPLSVPLSFVYTDGGFEFDTKPNRRHAQAFLAAGRATLLAHFEDYSPGAVLEQYVMAEGPVAFVDGVPEDLEAFGKARLEPETFIAMEYS